jgi:hypothetical protein
MLSSREIILEATKNTEVIDVLGVERPIKKGQVIDALMVEVKDGFKLIKITFDETLDTFYTLSCVKDYFKIIEKQEVIFGS